MITVIIATRNRPAMLRTALRSIERQTAISKIGRVIVSENGGNCASRDICNEFSSLPIRYIYRDPPLAAMFHAVLLFDEAAAGPCPYIAVLHDDDWWGENHISTGLCHLHRHPDASSYWASSFLVEGERSWIMSCWNFSSWIATEFGALTEVVKMGPRQAGLACLGSGPAHYSSLIAEKAALHHAFGEVAKSGNLFDNDRLLFMEFARGGPILMNLVPEVFVRQHPEQNQRDFSHAHSSTLVGTGTKAALDFCREQGVDVVDEFERLYQECPAPHFRDWFRHQLFDLRAVNELERQNALPLPHLFKALAPTPAPVRGAKYLAKQLCPPAILSVRRRITKKLGKWGLCFH